LMDMESCIQWVPHFQCTGPGKFVSQGLFSR